MNFKQLIGRPYAHPRAVKIRRAKPPWASRYLEIPPESIRPLDQLDDSAHGFKSLRVNPARKDPRRPGIDSTYGDVSEFWQVCGRRRLPGSRRNGDLSDPGLSFESRAVYHANDER